MTLKPIDIVFIVLLSLICGGGGAVVMHRYLAPPAPPQVVIFNSGKYVMDKLAEQVAAGVQPNPDRLVVETANFTAELAGRGAIVLNADAVLAAPGEAYVQPDAAKPTASQEGSHE